MTTSPNRVRKGVSEGGQFAADVHAEPAVVLPLPQRATYTAPFSGTTELHLDDYDEPLPAWPEGLSEPEVSYGFDDARVETYVEVDGQTMRFWTEPDGTYNSSDHGDDPWEDLDEEDREAALEWGAEVHKRIDCSTYSVMIDAASQPAVSEAVMAHATGKPAAPGPDLGDRTARDAYLVEAERKLYEARRDLQKTYLIGAAQEMKTQFPDIHSFTLSGNGEEPYVAEAWNLNGDPLDEAACSKASEVFRYRSHDDYDALMNGDEIYVDEAMAWRPAR